MFVPEATNTSQLYRRHVIILPFGVGFVSLKCTPVTFITVNIMSEAVWTVKMVGI